MTLLESFGLGEPGELVSIVGGGGKSALLFALGRLLPGRTVLTTTTRIFSAQMRRAAECCGAEPAQLMPALARGVGGLLVVGEVRGEKALGVPRELPGQILAHPRVDFVVVEADGSRMRPAKAPADHEPVVPAETTLLVPVVGIDALRGPLAESTHRPQLASALTGIEPERPLTPEGLGILLSHRRGGAKGAPDASRVIALVNKVEGSADQQLARQVARCALEEPRIDRVVVGALQCGDDADWRVYRR